VGRQGIPGSLVDGGCFTEEQLGLPFPRRDDQHGATGPGESLVDGEYGGDRGFAGLPTAAQYLARVLGGQHVYLPRVWMDANGAGKLHGSSETSVRKENW
jgi:hypothetical protein